MGYRKAEEILPVEIIELIQQYVDGQNIYIPRKSENRLEWGSGTEIKQELFMRNQQIYSEYLAGARAGAGGDILYLCKEHTAHSKRKAKVEK